MWAELSRPWQVCLEQAWEACCAGTVPIGAAVADPDGQVLAAGRNRIYAPQDVCGAYISGVRIAHAEVNALIAFDAGGVDPRQCTLYTTTEPCPMCAGAIVMANIRHVCFATQDIWAGATDLYQTHHYLRQKNMRVDIVSDLQFRDLLVALQVDYFLREDARGGKPIGVVPTHPLFSCFAEVSPTGAQFGLELFRDGRLEALRSARISAGVMIDRLDTMLKSSNCPK